MDGRPGVDFPGSAAERRDWFPDDGACLDYLDWLRWRDGFRCPHCGAGRSWLLPDGRRSCASCRRRSSPTAGTVFHRARAPLPRWFHAAWVLTAGEGGSSATVLQRELGLTSHQTAWAMLSRYRSAMGRHDPAGLAGVVEAGAARISGAGVVGTRTTGRAAAGRTGEAALTVAVAVERVGAGTGRCRLRVVSDGGARALGRFAREVAAPGAEVRTPVASERLEGVEAVLSAADDWLRGPLHGAVALENLPAHLDELAFRFDGRGPVAPGSRFHRLLALAVRTDPVRAADLVSRPAPRAPSPTPPPSPALPPPRKVVAAATARPWRRP